MLTMEIVMKETANKNWTGTFDELITQANKILLKDDKNQKPINSRLARHYMQIGAVGRGVKNGRNAIFSLEDVNALVAVKKLASDGFPLKAATTLINSSKPSKINEQIEASGTTPAAVDVVKSLLNNKSKSGNSIDSVMSKDSQVYTSNAIRSITHPSLTAPPSQKVYYQNVVDDSIYPLNDNAKLEYSIGNWLQVKIDPIKMHNLKENEKKEKIDHLINWLNKQKN